MSQVQTIFKNMSWLLVSRILNAVCGFVWTILITRYLGASNYGIMSFAISLTGILAITMDLGISTHIVRHIATDFDSAPRYLGNAIPLKSIFSFVTFLLALVLLIIMHCDEITIQITLLFTIQTIFTSFTNLFNGSLQAVEEGKYQAIGNIILTILLLIFILLSIFGDFGLYGITFAYLIANILVTIFQYLTVEKRLSRPKIEFDWEFCKKITLYSIPFALTSFFGVVIYNADMVMITTMVSSYANGIYSAAYKLVSVLTLFYGIYSTVVFPVMSRLFVNEKNLLVLSFEKSLKYLMLFILPISFAIIFYSSDIVLLIFGNEYLQTSTVLSIIMWTVPISFINGVCLTLLNASHKEKYVTIVYLIATIFNVGLNFIIIPKYSYNGAAFTTILCDLLITVLYFYSIYTLDAMPRKGLYLDLFKILIGSLILYALLVVLNLNMWVAIPVGIIIYLVSLNLLRLFDDDDKYVIKEIITNNLPFKSSKK